MVTILKVVLLELENFLCKKTLWILTAIYTISAFVICLFPDLRQSYFADIESVPVMLLNFVAPVFLVIILISMLSPVFVGDKENNVNQIPAACLVGRKGRSIAKMLAAICLAVLLCIIVAVIAFAVPFLCNLFDGNLKIEYVGTELELTPIWSTWQHFGFSFISLTVACIILTLFVLFISCNTRTTIAAVSVSSILVVFEFLFNRFSFPTMIQEYNIWVFFEPYYLFVMNIFNISPYMNLFLLSVAFLPLCMLAIWQIVRNGGH